jgi:hypothetical protein
MRKVLTVICSLAFVLAMVVPIARAGIWDDATQVTFKAPFRVPGNKVIPAGTYWFLKTGTERNNIEIWAADRSKQIATIEAIEDSSVATTETKPTPPKDRSEFVFAKANTPNAPMALVKWLNPGDQPALQFVYSDQERQQFSSAEGDQMIVLAEPTTHPHTEVPPSEN